MKMISAFKDHPASVGETYSEHFGSATGFGLRLLLAGGACIVHAILPFLFERTASRMVTALHQRMVTARHRHAAPETAQRLPLTQVAR